ncbi:hypothetical protein IWW42_001024 [Coemansia sp. RSA 1085]|nr:hypothetical protein LPJ68_004226 [Coemansia sp. RSA 1086]KAJ2650355.1 hypothetical protein IWW40_002532 [Coemansia sp. RSA 1250]KAJ2675602.1 hypothetical protein IWW42_001024 [Coemansia sp. RSA 1085]
MPSAVVVSKGDFGHLQELSSRFKVIREPVRELARVAVANSNEAAKANRALLERVREQLNITQQALHEYLASVPGIGAEHPALSRPHQTRNNTQQRSSQSSESTARSRSSTQNSQDSGNARHARPASLSVSTADSGQHAMAKSPAAAQSRKPSSRSQAQSPKGTAPLLVQAAATVHARADAAGLAVDKAVVRLWDGPVEAVAARAVNEVSVRLGKRHLSPLEERIPQKPLRSLQSDSTPIDIVDLINSMFRTSITENEPSLVQQKIESIPPGIVASAIANSTGQIFAQLKEDMVKEYARGKTQMDSQPVLRLLSDHANYLTRLMETTIVYPIHAAQRARRIEWWTAVACLVRELGDYESLSSLVCVFSGASVGRLNDTWELVSGACKSAIRFILDRVLKILPNYASYRDEFQLRVRRIRRRRTERINIPVAPDADELSLDFDSAIAINTPDLCSADDNYVDSCLFSKEAFDLPAPRALVPIVAVLLKDAVSSGVSASDPAPTPASRRKSMLPKSPAEAAMDWASVIESCQAISRPLSLDYFMLRRIFATELSSLSSLAPPSTSSQSTHSSLARGAMSTASSFLKRMPRRRTSFDREIASKELSMSACRLLAGGGIVPSIMDVLAHCLFVAAGNPCYSCSMGALLEPMHVATSGQIAVAITAMLLFAEPWMPREYLARLCDMREPRMQPLAGSRTLSPPSTSSHSQGYESRSADRPWLMSFKLADSADSSRYFKTRSVMPPPRDFIAPAEPKTAESDPANGELPGAGKPKSDRLHRRSLSSHTAVGVPPLPAGEVPPPLPATEMPTWVPTSKSPPKSPPLSRSAPRDSQALCSPPPLPSQPMPRFQPAESSQPPPLPAAKMPNMFDIVPGSSIPPPHPKHIDAISAETQMLLSFESRSRSRKH